MESHTLAPSSRWKRWNRDSIHFLNTLVNRVTVTTMLETAIDITDAIMQLGFARHVMELASINRDIQVRTSEPLPRGPQELANEEVRTISITKQKQVTAHRRAARQNSAARVINMLEAEDTAAQEEMSAGGDSARSSNPGLADAHICHPKKGAAKSAPNETADRKLETWRLA